MTSGDIYGVYDSSIDEIIIKREALKNTSMFCEILFHELAHATTGRPDNDREFENELGKIIGTLSLKITERTQSTNLTESPKKKKFWGFNFKSN